LGGKLFGVLGVYGGALSANLFIALIAYLWFQRSLNGLQQREAVDGKAV
jgi:hypothetical protein